MDQLLPPLTVFPKGESLPELKEGMPPYVDKDLGAEGIFMAPVSDESPLAPLLDSKGFD